MKDENKSPAERLERALQDLKNRKKAAAVSAAKFDQELEKFDEVQKKLDALPYHERREVLDASGLKHRSRAPRPIITPRDISRYIPPSRPPEVLAMAAPTEQLAPAPNTATSAPVVTAGDAPAPLNTTIHSTKARRDSLTPVIELAQSKCRNPNDTAEVWAALQVLAETKSAPLIGGTEDGLQFLKGGIAEIFKRSSLGKRLAR